MQWATVALLLAILGHCVSFTRAAKLSHSNRTGTVAPLEAEIRNIVRRSKYAAQQCLDIRTDTEPMPADLVRAHYLLGRLQEICSPMAASMLADHLRVLH